jgi:hypothetical protein
MEILKKIKQLVGRIAIGKLLSKRAAPSCRKRHQVRMQHEADS